MKHFYLLALFLLFASTCVAQDNRVPLWGRWERTFEAAPRTNPDPSIGLLVRLTSPSGKRHKVSAFWDGGKTWRVRFMPNEAGKWHFRTIAYPDYVGLHAKRGTFVCRPAKENNRFLKHGAVRVSKSGTHLEHADGTPFFWLGDTAWNGALLSKPDDWNKYLADRVAKKFTAIQFVTTQWRSAPGNLEGEVAFIGTEKIQINPAFFKRMDARFDALNKQGLLAVPVLLWAIRGDENPGWYLPEDQAILLEKYLVARYGAHHVVWIPAGDTTYREANGEKWRRISRAVFGDEPHAPIVMHPQGMQSYAENYKSEQLHKGTGIAKPWFDAMKLPGSQQMKFLHEFFASMKWWELRPDASLVETQSGDPAKFIAAAKTLRGDTAVVYFPAGGEVTIKALTPAEWFDPRTGQWQAANKEGDNFRAPTTQDWLLKLKLK